MNLTVVIEKSDTKGSNGNKAISCLVDSVKWKDVTETFWAGYLNAVYIRRGVTCTPLG